MFDRRLVQNFDWVLFSTVIILSTIGIINLYSATVALTDSPTPLYIKQVYWFVIGLIAMVLVFTFSYQHLNNYAYHLYVLSILLLLFVLLFGDAISGSKRWIELGFVSFQPSEITKLTLVLALARYLSRSSLWAAPSLKHLIVPVLLLVLPFSLIIMEPDLGTAILLFIIFISILLFSGVKCRPFLYIIPGIILTLPLGWFLLKDYQRLRIISFFDPGRDPLGAGYHAIQSKIAIGSGLFLGKGFLKGTQTQLNFLPEHHTDFIFSVLAEEWGFLGSIILIALYLSLIFCGLRIARQSRNRFGTILAMGIVFLIFWQVAINLAMTIGLLPIVGVPLPLIGYGGSSMVSTFLGVGILLNISSRRFMFQSKRLEV